MEPHGKPVSVGGTTSSVLACQTALPAGTEQSFDRIKFMKNILLFFSKWSELGFISIFLLDIVYYFILRNNLEHTSHKFVLTYITNNFQK